MARDTVVAVEVEDTEEVTEEEIALKGTVTDMEEKVTNREELVTDTEVEAKEVVTEAEAVDPATDPQELRQNSLPVNAPVKP